jgi:hypothetical protein
LEDFIISGKEAWMIAIFLFCGDSALDPKIVRNNAFGYFLYSVGDVINNDYTRYIERYTVGT